VSSDTTTDPATLAAEIGRTREDLGRSRADVDARFHAAGTIAPAGTIRDRVAMTVRRPVPVAVIAAVTSATVVAVTLIRRSRR
jgi:hypothetical protein